MAPTSRSRPLTAAVENHTPAPLPSVYQTRGMAVSDVARERLDSQTQQHNCAQNTAPGSKGQAPLLVSRHAEQRRPA
ncbi:hypothetical protein PBI_OMNICRON_94 [Mycobacterium phage Omnicron]|uniref:Uncharacterized protein n=1 Tax=Mycobacterium phage Omnicron TaxID=1541819 RepID=A0A088FRJ5_9CAUD|nr:hypothetical protein PBI_OMNICRON_94 [Mycobacterium phage Omnicron]AIM50427.1 hypothetical protein PBI_OMNICRON_94 [Mycobacterium phage Omnicron]